MKDTIKFDVPVSGSAQVDLVEVTASGEPEALAFFMSKTLKFFEQGAKDRVRHANQKLTEDQVREIKKIRREKGWGRTRLARKFKVGKTTIERILNGETWRDVE